MKYSEKTLKNAINRFKNELSIANEKNYSEMKLHISTGNRKIGKAYNFSMVPILSCSNCSGCMHYCYDIKACLMYPEVIKARVENYGMMLKNRNETFQKIDDFISKKRKNKYFRWHVSGEILDSDYFIRMINIAKNHPDWVFWTYTKNYNAVNQVVKEIGIENMPENLSVMFSVWNGMKMENPYNFPTFTCIQEGMEVPENQYHCPGNCDICKMNHRGCIANESTYCFEH